MKITKLVYNVAKCDYEEVCFVIPDDKANIGVGNYYLMQELYVNEREKVQVAIEKLAKLEDIEEEIGIDLITLFKALKQGYIYEKIGDEIIKSDVDMLDFREGIKGVCIDKSYGIDNYKQCYQTLKYINGYGKSWALTKEELLEEEE